MTEDLKPVPSRRHDPEMDNPAPDLLRWAKIFALHYQLEFGHPLAELAADIAKTEGCNAHPPA